MPFGKDNQIWKSSHNSRAANKNRIQDFLSMIANGGIETYGDFMDLLARNKDLGDNQKEFLDRMEKWKDHIAAKKAPVDEDNNTVRPVIVLPAELMEKNDIKSKD